MSKHQITSDCQRARLIPSEVEARLLLVHFIREELSLTGTHIGCDTTNCGACTVLMNGVAVKSCTMFAVTANGETVETIEGWRKTAQLASVAGRLLGETRPAMRLLHTGHDHECQISVGQESHPTEDEIRRGISGNLCRCTGYNKIVEAIQYAAEKLGEEVASSSRGAEKEVTA